MITKMTKKYDEGFYILRIPSEADVVVHGYYCKDEGAFVFGFNTHDGGGLVREDDLVDEAKVIPVTVYNPFFLG